MSKRAQIDLEQDQECTASELEEIDDFEIENSDRGFLLDKDGNLKTVFGPTEGFSNPSENVAAILEIFGISELTLPNRTLH